MNQTLLSSSKLNAWNVLTVVALALAVLNLANGGVSAQEPRQTQQPLLRTLTVTGRGVETIPATIAQVQLGVEVQGTTAARVQEEVARRSSAVVELLRSRNVEKLQTTGIRLNPVYSFNDNVQRLTGYSGSNIVSFRINTDRVGDLLDAAVQAGATRIDGINFVASDSALAIAQEQALREATQDAQRQANAVLSALNFTQREIVSIQVNNASPPQPLLLRSVALERSDAIAAQTPVIAGEQQVEASVTLQIRY